MKNKKKCIIGIISAVILVAAAVTAIIIYRKQIASFITDVKERITGGKPKFTPEECEDFADI